jgi:hypothetical protein
LKARLTSEFSGGSQGAQDLYHLLFGETALPNGNFGRIDELTTMAVWRINRTRLPITVLKNSVGLLISI